MMTFWNTETIKYLHSVAYSVVKPPEEKFFADGDTVTKIVISKRGTFGVKRGRNKPRLQLWNDKLNTYMFYEIHDLVAKELLLLDFFRTSGMKYLFSTDKDNTFIRLEGGGINYGDLRKLITKFVAVHP